MSLNQVTQRILEIVEEVSGLPMIVQADPTVPVAALLLGRGPAPAHVVRFNPNRPGETDYNIAFQCGFIVRIYSTPAEKRFDVHVSSRGKKEVQELSAEHFAKQAIPIPAPARSQLLGQFADGLIVQLRSMPIALRVDNWLRRDFPDVAEQQKTSNSRQLNENTTCVRPDVVKMTPPPILRPNVSMNAAFAAFWSRTWADPLLTVPYKASGNLADGQALLKIWDEIPDEPSDDRQLIEAWGQHLKLTDWFEIIPFV